MVENVTFPKGDSYCLTVFSDAAEKFDRLLEILEGRKYTQVTTPPVAQEVFGMVAISFNNSSEAIQVSRALRAEGFRTSLQTPNDPQGPIIALMG